MNPKFLLVLVSMFFFSWENLNSQECNAEGGALTYTNESTVYSICVGDGVANPFDVILNGSVGDSSAWVVTDPDGIILDLPEAPPFDFEGAGVGTCQLWHLSYTDSISGLTVGSNSEDLSGCFDLSNAISLIRSQSVEGGEIRFRDTMPTFDFCAGSEEFDEVEVILEDQTGSNSAWVITDPNSKIIELPAGPPFDFSEAGPGTCLIWHLSFEDGLSGLEVGENVGSLDGCYDLSNFISVVRGELAGGKITTRDTLIDVSFCPGGEESKAVEVILEEGAGDKSAWALTDQAGIIMELPLGPPFDVSGLNLEICKIWNITYADELTGLEVGEDIVDIGGCHGLSNPITINKAGIEGGRIYLPGDKTETTICLGDGITELKFASKAGTTGSQSQWLITNEEGYITSLPKAPPFSFENNKPGICLIWHLSYEGNIIGLQKGSNTTNLQGCFALSNVISIIKAEVAAGKISLRDSTIMSASICTATEENNSVDVEIVEDGDGESQAWIITDEDDVIVQIPDGPPFDFSDEGTGINTIWHITYSGELDGLDPGNVLDDLDGCYALSNSIEVNLSGGADGGIISTLNNKTDITICVDDNSSDLVEVDLSNESNHQTGWIIINEDGEILDLPTGPPFDFTNAGAGVCFIYHISWVDEISGLEVGADLEELFGCYDLSNSIEVRRKVGACNSDHLLEYGSVSNVGSEWITVEVNNQYKSMVVVATPVIKDVWTKPVVTRVRNADGGSFELSVQNPGASTTSANYSVHYIVAEEGVYREELDGINMEARKMESVLTSTKKDWYLEARKYENNYLSPVILGQVMTTNDDRWSVFWSSEKRRKIFSPRAFSFAAGKHAGEDPDKEREIETLGVIVMDAGFYELDGMRWEVNVTPKAIRGVHETNLGFTHETSLDEIQGAVLSSFGMRGSNFGWPVLFGEEPFEGKNFKLAIDEDQINDLERRHPKEEVAYIVFGTSEGRLVAAPKEAEISSKEIIKVETDKISTPKLKIFPNPTAGRFTLKIDIASRTNARIEIMNLQGVRISNWRQNLEQGINLIEVDDNRLENGMYNLIMVTDEGIHQKQKFIILR